MNARTMTELRRAFADIIKTQDRMTVEVAPTSIHTDQIDERAAGVLCANGFAVRHRNFDSGVLLTDKGVAAAVISLRNQLTDAQLRDLVDSATFESDHPEWSIPDPGVTSRGLALAGCIVRPPGSSGVIVLTRLGRMIAAAFSATV